MRSKFLFSWCMLFIACALYGCGHAPQLSGPNRKILEALQSAVSSKKMEWVEVVVKQIDEKREKKEMSDAEFRAIDVVIKTAKSGEWKAAQKASFMLSEGQRATSQDLAMLKDRKSAKDASPN